jgi:hypothetical protein
LIFMCRRLKLDPSVSPCGSKIWNCKITPRTNREYTDHIGIGNICQNDGVGQGHKHAGANRNLFKCKS